MCIRKALGQIMEYAFYPDKLLATRLIIIGELMPEQEVISYLKRIRNDFKISVYYRAFDMNENILSEEF